MSSRKRKAPSELPRQAELRRLLGPASHDCRLCDDAVDPVSQERIWEEDARGNRVPGGEIEYLFTWEEKQAGRTFVRGLGAETVSRMLAASPEPRHPVSGLEVPAADLARARELVRALESAGVLEKPRDDFAELELHELTDEKVRHFATSVCQLFSAASLFIDEAVFLGLSHPQLATLISELRDMFAQNFSDPQRRQLGEVPFSSPPASKLALQHYVLRETQRVVRAANGSLRNLVLYVLLGGLAVVSRQVRERYMESFAHNFHLPA